MSSPAAASAPGLGRALFAFAAALVMGQILLTGIEALFPNLKLPSVMGLVLVLAASMTGGQSFARRAGRVMTPGEKLRFALMATAIALLLSFVVLSGLLAANGVPVSLDTLTFALTGDRTVAADLTRWLWAAVAVGAVLSMLVAYIAVGIGAKIMIRAQEKAAGR